LETQVKAKIYKDTNKKPTSYLDEEEENEIKIGKFPLSKELQPPRQHFARPNL